MRHVLLSALLVAGCAGAGVTRSGVCPATELARFVGAPVVELAANETLKPLRVVPEGAGAAAERPERLTIRADGEGRIAALSCG